jgi:hypothetical protein
MKKFVVGALLVAGALALSAQARAQGCWICDQSLLCSGSSAGGAICQGNGYVCAVGMPCATVGGPGGGCGFAQGKHVVALRIALVELRDARQTMLLAKEWASSSAGAGEGVYARAVRGIERPGVTRPGALRLEDAFVTFVSAPLTARYETPSGDGFTVRVICGSASPRLFLSRLNQGRPGRVIAQQNVEGDDLLLARLMIDGKLYAVAIDGQMLDRAAPGHAERVRTLQTDLQREIAQQSPARSLELRMSAQRE